MDSIFKVSFDDFVNVFNAFSKALYVAETGDKNIKTEEIISDTENALLEVYYAQTSCPLPQDENGNILFVNSGIYNLKESSVDIVAFVITGQKICKLNPLFGTPLFKDGSVNNYIFIPYNYRYLSIEEKVIFIKKIFKRIYYGEVNTKFVKYAEYICELCTYLIYNYNTNKKNIPYFAEKMISETVNEKEKFVEILDRDKFKFYLSEYIKSID